MIRLITIGIFLVLANMLSAQPLIPVKVEGKVVTGPANDSVPFVNVFIINRHQGTITDNQGKFSFMANVGDTLLFSSMGFQSEKVVIPYDVSPKYHLEQHLILDTLFLQEILIFPWDNYYAFKQAVLHTYPPKTNEDRALENFRHIAEQMAYDDESDIPNAAAAYSVSLNKQKEDLYYKGQIRTLSLLNPIAWAQFFKALNDGSLKDPHKKKK
jgi:hypothetical protein